MYTTRSNVVGIKYVIIEEQINNNSDIITAQNTKMVIRTKKYLQVYDTLNFIRGNMYFKCLVI